MSTYQLSQEDFFTIDEKIVLALPPALPAPSTHRDSQSLRELHDIYESSFSFQSTFSLPRTFSRISLASGFSTDTFLSRDLNQLDPTIPLSSLLDVISRHRSLQHARIVQADSYHKFNGRVVHRFIVLELERDDRQTIWLRIDRRRDESLGLLSFVANRAKAQSDDRVSDCLNFTSCFVADGQQAWLSADKRLVSEGLSAEHTTVFGDASIVPTLGDLRWVFYAIVQVLKRYELFRVRQVALALYFVQKY